MVGSLPVFGDGLITTKHVLLQLYESYYNYKKDFITTTKISLITTTEKSLTTTANMWFNIRFTPKTWSYYNYEAARQ